VAVGTRSSLASLPALVAGGQQHLGLPPSATGFVLPLAVASFKLNMVVSGPVKLLFLAHVFQVPLGLPQMATFLITDLILSFSTAGIPSMGTVRSIPAYLAAGIPLEGVLMLNAVDTIPDIFKTLTNVTADMSAATVLSRRERRRVAAATAEAAPLPQAATRSASPYQGANL
jgi:Na+/H+-dicarboxylate symporter